MIKGHYTAIRIVRTSVNMLLLIVMVLLAVSSAIMSGYAPWDIKGGMVFARLEHLASSYWGFVLVIFPPWNLLESDDCSKENAKTDKSSF